jgi:indole-3-glycerol phosphate synthase
MGLLQEILLNKQSELAALRERPKPAEFSPRRFDLARANTGRLGLICEVKRRSPSAGALSSALSVEQRAQAYARGGADLISVLCDARYFDGDYAHLQRIRRVCDVPLLCKEFVIDEAQLDAAAAFGADAVLLIVRCVTPQVLERLIRAAHARGLTPLVEVYTEEEAALAVSAGAVYIGVNARDLDTLQLDRQRARAVLEQLPEGIVRVHLSGLHSASDVAAVRQSAADAALIGEALMRQDDPTALLSELVTAARA